MPDVTVTYKGSTIGSLSASGSLTLETEGTYCEGDIGISYTAPSGGDIAAKAVKVLQIAATGDSTFSIDLTKFTNLTTLSNFIALNPFPFSDISIKPQSTALITDYLCVCQASAGTTVLKTVAIDGTLKLKSGTSTSYGPFAQQKGLKTITGTLDLTAQTRAQRYNGTSYENTFQNCAALEDVRFTPGSMPATTTNWTLQWLAALTDASLVSIANSLKDTYSGTITFHSTPKSRLASIMGTVATADGLSTFTIDAGGTVSLQDFLTTTKGATLA